MPKGYPRKAITLARHSASLNGGRSGWSWLATIVLAQAAMDLESRDPGARMDAERFLATEWAGTLMQLAMGRVQRSGQVSRGAFVRGRRRDADLLRLEEEVYGWVECG